MERDFTFAVYRNLLTEIKDTGLPVFPLREYFSLSEIPAAFFILRHDVDRRPLNALRMALLESSLGIHSTYYFRVSRQVFKKDLIREIRDLGHEIGYHYEVMDKARGDVDLAETIFKDELKRLKSVADIHTVCMHGNPLTSRDNRDFWRHCSLSQFDLIGEAYLSIQDPDLFYITDTGRGWNKTAYNIQDHFPDGSISPLESVSSTRQLTEAIKEGRFTRLYLQSHPNRWSWKPAQWYRQWGEDLMINCLKYLITCYHQRKRYP